jgi:uncharacterized protein (DUF58 family)
MPVQTFNQQQVRDFERLDFLARQIVEGFITGLHKSPYHGFSVEFAEHRLYNTGESTRHIDWKLYARTDKLFVKRYEEETNLRCQVVIDTSGSMHYPAGKTNVIEDANKLGFSVYAAAALVNLLRRQRDASGLTLFDEQIHYHSRASNTMRNQLRLYTELSKLLQVEKKGKSLKTTDLATTLHEIAERLHKRSIVVLFTDMINTNEADTEKVFAALQHMRYNKHEVLLFHLADKKHEVEFAFENRPHQFVDMETGARIKLNPVEIREAYQKANAQRFTALKLRCSQYRIDLIEADINQGFNDVLLGYMLKRQKLF